MTNYEHMGEQAPNPVFEQELVDQETAIANQPSIMDRVGNTKIGAGIAIAAATVALVATNAKEVFARGDSVETPQAQTSEKSKVTTVDAYPATLANDYNPKKIVQKSVGCDPITVTYTMPHIPKYGQPTYVSARFKYDTRARYGSGKNCFKKNKLPSYSKVFKKKQMQIYDIEAVEQYSTGSWLKDTGINGSTSGKGLIESNKASSIRVKPNRSKVVGIMVNFDKCYDWPTPTTESERQFAEAITGFAERPPSYTCTPAELSFRYKSKISGRYTPPGQPKGNRKTYKVGAESTGGLLTRRIRVDGGVPQ
jgi:hypothetical protein